MLHPRTAHVYHPLPRSACAQSRKAAGLLIGVGEAGARRREEARERVRGLIPGAAEGPVVSRVQRFGRGAGKGRWEMFRGGGHTGESNHHHTCGGHRISFVPLQQPASCSAKLLSGSSAPALLHRPCLHPPPLGHAISQVQSISPSSAPAPLPSQPPAFHASIIITIIPAHHSTYHTAIALVPILPPPCYSRTPRRRPSATSCRPRALLASAPP